MYPLIYKCGKRHITGRFTGHSRISGTQKGTCVTSSFSRLEFGGELYIFGGIVDPSPIIKMYAICQNIIQMYLCMHISSNALYLCTRRMELRTWPQRCTCALLLTICTYRIIHTGVGTYDFSFTPDHQDDSITLSCYHK